MEMSHILPGTMAMQLPSQVGKYWKSLVFALLLGRQLHLLLFTFSFPWYESVTSTYISLKSKRYMQVCGLSGPASESPMGRETRVRHLLPSTGQR